VQQAKQGRFVAGIQRRHEAVEHGECRGYRGLVRLGLSLVDTDGLSPPGAWSAASSDHRLRIVQLSRLVSPQVEAV